MAPTALNRPHTGVSFLWITHPVRPSYYPRGDLIGLHLGALHGAARCPSPLLKGTMSTDE